MNSRWHDDIAKSCLSLHHSLSLSSSLPLCVAPNYDCCKTSLRNHSGGRSHPKRDRIQAKPRYKRHETVPHPIFIWTWPTIFLEKNPTFTIPLTRQDTSLGSWIWDREVLALPHSLAFSCLAASPPLIAPASKSTMVCGKTSPMKHRPKTTWLHGMSSHVSKAVSYPENLFGVWTTWKLAKFPRFLSILSRWRYSKDGSWCPTLVLPWQPTCVGQTVGTKNWSNIIESYHCHIIWVFWTSDPIRYIISHVKSRIGYCRLT